MRPTPAMTVMKVRTIGNEAGQDDGAGAVVVEEVLGAVDVLLAEESGVGLGEDRRPRLAADPVADDVAGDCCDGEDEADEGDVGVDEAAGHQEARDEEQRVARAGRNR